MPNPFRLAAPMILLLGAAQTATAQSGPMPTIIHPDGGSAQATARRARDGHFYFQTAVNGTPIPMVFDTGATQTVLRAEDAAKAGFDVARLSYSGVSNTANGAAAYAPITLSTLTVGDITRHNIAAAVAKPGALTVTLLGQTFMARLKGFKVEGQQLVLQGD